MSTTPSCPHSASISSVHFLDTPSFQRASSSSLRLDAKSPTRSQGPSKARSSSPIRSAGPRSPGSTPPLNGTSLRSNDVPRFSSGVNGVLGASGLPAHVARRSSHDRRGRSEGGGLLTRMERSGSLLGKRASIVTGGYETSESSDIDHEEGEGDEERHGQDGALTANGNGDGRPKLALPASSSFGGTASGPGSAQRGGSFRTHSAEGRRRSKSLMSPAMEEVFESSGSRHQVQLQLPPRDKEREKRKRPKDGRRGSRDMLRSSESFKKSKGDTARHAEKDRDRDNDMGRGEGTSPTDAGAGRVGEGPRATDSADLAVAVDRDGRRKGKARERPANGLASSLGLVGAKGDVALSADQINNLLSDSDVASALRMLHSGGTASLTPHYAITHPTPSLSSASGPSRPASPPQKPKPEPYIVQAPPALLQDDLDRRDRAASVASTIAPRRERSISISSSIAPARERSSWTTRQPPTIAEKPAARARAGSRADYDGGHVPFTHHLPTAQIDEDARSVATTETAPGTQENGSANGDHAPHKESTSLGVKEKRKEGMPKSRLSQLFHLKKKKSSDSIPSEKSHRLQTPHITHAAIDEARHKLIKDRPAQRESEDTDKDIERRRIEKERRDAELAQERRFKALTQVTSHPSSERAAYKASSHLRAYYTLIYDGLDDPPRMNPLAVLRWKHKTEEQSEARAKWERERKLNGSTNEFGAVHSSPVSINSRAPRPSTSTSERPAPAHRWRYSIGDITAYNDADGVVNYFIPPRPTYEELRARSSHSTSARSPSPAGPHDTLARSPSPNVKQGSSVAGSMDKSVGRANVTSASTVSLAAPPSTMDTDPLSRSASIENKRYPRDHRLTHRTHQSLGSIGPHAIGHALKAPFEKLGSVARKQRGETFSPQTDEESVDMRRHHLGASTRRDWRVSERDRERVDDDRQGEQREFHLRKLFLKGQRLAPRSHLHLRPDVDRTPSGGGKGHDREAELRALQTALARETAFRERQAEKDRQTELERDARERMRVLEDEIYTERAGHLAKARQRLDSINANIAGMDENVRHYFAQIDQLSSVAKVSGEVDMQFANIAPIRNAYAKKPETRASRGEAADVLGPLRAYESASGSEARRSGSRQNSLTLPGTKRKGSMGPLPQLYSHGIKPWPRRFSLAPDGSHRVDPIRRTELTLAQAQSQQDVLRSRIDAALKTLQGMLGTIDGLMKQKDAVRAWTKTALEHNRTMRNTVDGLKADLAGGTKARFDRLTDLAIDRGARMFVGPLLQLVLNGMRSSRWAFSWRNEHTRRSFQRERERGGTRSVVMCWTVLGVIVLAWALLYRYGESWEE